MTTTITMDPVGRVVVPHAVRERLGLLGARHELEVLDTPEGIVLRPIGEAVPVTRHASGWRVFHSGPSESADPVTAVEATRRARHRDVSGG